MWCEGLDMGLWLVIFIAVPVIMVSSSMRQITTLKRRRAPVLVKLAIGVAIWLALCLAQLIVLVIPAIVADGIASQARVGVILVADAILGLAGWGLCYWIRRPKSPVAGERVDDGHAE